MAAVVHALLVGINHYPAPVGELNGCLNDLQGYVDLLTDFRRGQALELTILRDAQATREAVVDAFRQIRKQLRPEDRFLFQYAGHGARSASAPEFRRYYPDGWDEGLVCYNSRLAGGRDLADKELAVLLADMAQTRAEVVCIFDCCHSGSATRTADDLTLTGCRQTFEVHESRPLETYLDGYYVDPRQPGTPRPIPSGRHVLLAACHRTQKAWETRDHAGVFSKSLLDVLHRSGPAISYADLFVRVRAAVRKEAENQEPQFETYAGFSAYAGFLGQALATRGRRYSVYFENQRWRADCGALHGLPTDPDRQVELALYSEAEPTRQVGRAMVSEVGAQKSTLEWLDPPADQPADQPAGRPVEPTERLLGELTSLPVPPLIIFLEGDEPGKQTFTQFLSAVDRSMLGVELMTDSPESARYTLLAENQQYRLLFRETGRVIQGAKGYTQAAAEHLFGIMKQVADWERSIALRNPATQFDPNQVPFHFTELLEDREDGQQFRFDQSEITFDIVEQDHGWSFITGMLKASNRTGQPLYLLLVHYANDYSAEVLYNEWIDATEEEFIITLDGNSSFGLTLEAEEGHEALHTFKLIVSTEKVDDFLLGLESIELGWIYDPATARGERGLNLGTARKKPRREQDWFTKDLHVKLVRQLGRTTTADTELAQGQITIKGHPAFQANISLSSAKTPTRGLGTTPDCFRVLERAQMTLLNFSGGRGEEASILELTDIQNPECLRDQPLEIELAVGLAEHEYLLPVTFDGEHLLLVGEPSRDEAGVTRLTIREIPEIPDQRRTLGKALKMYFCKSYLKQENVNKLAWIEYHADGTFVRHPEGVLEKVSRAKKIMLLVHGIIGNTDSLVQGLWLAQDANQRRVSAQFDLVLTYDYENLNTPIQQTAELLKRQLNDVGLAEGGDKHLALMVHSMGGLVSRWLIEKLEGNRFIKHLAMFGTPNDGSPYGEVGAVRNLASLLTTLAINTIPAFAPFGAAILSVLVRSQKLTPTLEQMNQGSPFLSDLNRSGDPRIPYTIVAGDVRDYQEESEKRIPQLLAKLGGGKLFALLFHNVAHDMAVSDDSIGNVSHARTPAPDRHDILCHHLNYFSANASLQTLAKIPWEQP